MLIFLILKYFAYNRRLLSGVIVDVDIIVYVTAAVAKWQSVPPVEGRSWVRSLPRDTKDVIKMIKMEDASLLSASI